MPKVCLVFRSWPGHTKPWRRLSGWYAVHSNDMWGYGPFETRAEAYRWVKTEVDRKWYLPFRTSTHGWRRQYMRYGGRIAP